MGTPLTFCRAFLAKALIIGFFSPTFAIAGIQFRNLETLPQSLTQRLDRTHQGQKIGNFEFSRLEFKFNGRDRFSVELPGASVVYQEGMPAVPSVTHLVPEKVGYTAEILLNVGQVEKSVGPIPLVKTPVPYIWGEVERFLPAPRNAGFFPGHFLKVLSSGKEAFAQVFPVQYDLATGEVIRLKDASLWVRYVPRVFTVPTPQLQTPEALIITSRELQAGAQNLARQQYELGKVFSDVVYVEDLANHPSLSEDNLPNGYKNSGERDQKVKPYDPNTGRGYKYELAKKIAKYLQDRMLSDGSKLRYVTILGNAEQVPPSYYFTLRAFSGRKWGVTDQCYGAINQCKEPKVALGRLPLGTNLEVEAYLKKSKRYILRKDLPSKELSLVAGKAFPNAEVYIGELGTLRTIDSPQSDWVGVEKVFRTKFTYTPTNVKKLATGEFDSKFVYALDHGKGNQWFVEGEFFTSENINQAKAVEGSNSPVMISIACSNAAFDPTVTNEPIFANLEYGNESIGVSFLKANGGPIAYWGEARPGLGTPIYDFDLKGNLTLKGSAYGTQLLEGFFEGYQAKRKGRLGDFVLKAQRRFALESGNNMEEEGNAWSYFITTLLGDPTLILPDRPRSGDVSSPLAIAKTLFTRGETMPFHTFTGPEELTLRFDSSSPVDATLFQWLLEAEFGAFETEQVIAEQKGITGEGTIPLKLLDKSSIGTYFLRLENTVGVPRERQVWFNVLPTE